MKLFLTAIEEALFLVLFLVVYGSALFMAFVGG